MYILWTYVYTSICILCKYIYIYTCIYIYICNKKSLHLYTRNWVLFEAIIQTGMQPQGVRTWEDFTGLSLVSAKLREYPALSHSGNNFGFWTLSRSRWCSQLGYKPPWNTLKKIEMWLHQWLFTFTHVDDNDNAFPNAVGVCLRHFNGFSIDRMHPT